MGWKLSAPIITDRNNNWAVVNNFSLLTYTSGLRVGQYFCPSQTPHECVKNVCHLRISHRGDRNLSGKRHWYTSTSLTHPTNNLFETPYNLHSSVYCSGSHGEMGNSNGFLYVLMFHLMLWLKVVVGNWDYYFHTFPGRKCCNCYHLHVITKNVLSL